MKKLYISLIITSSILNAKFITIGTGGVTGTYYVTGSEICKLLNKIKKQTNLRCSAEATGGSIYNINAIKNKELDFGIVQNDVVYQSNKKSNSIRTVMAIYPELFTLVTRKDANIHSYKDLKNKRINIGNRGSGNEATALAMFQSIGFKKSDLKFAGSLESVEMPDALRDNKIDGYFYMVGHPTQNIINATNSVDVKITPLRGDAIDKFVNDNPYFIKSSIKGGLYKGNYSNISTFGVKAVLVTNSEVSNENVYILVKSILENFEAFKKLHPAYYNITKESLLLGLSAPLHDGAKKYFKEVGLLKD